MCAVFKVQEKTFRPGREIPAIGPGGTFHRIWAGFARNEILNWWIQRGGVLLDIPADEFAERSDSSGELVWDAVGQGLVIRALLDRQTAHELVKIVTREATPAEREKFQHDRMPVLEKPLHDVSSITVPAAPSTPKKPAPDGLVQEMLFDF